MAPQNDKRPGRARRWTARAVNVVIPLSPAKAVIGDAKEAANHIGSAWRFLWHGTRKALERHGDSEHWTIYLPSGEDERRIVRNARVTWWVCVGMAIAGVAVGVMATQAHSILHLLNGAVGAVALLLAGLVKSLDAARVVAALRIGRPLAWREFVSEPKWFIPY